MRHIKNQEANKIYHEQLKIACYYGIIQVLPAITSIIARLPSLNWFLYPREQTTAQPCFSINHSSH